MFKVSASVQTWMLFFFVGYTVLPSTDYYLRRYYGHEEDCPCNVNCEWRSVSPSASSATTVDPTAWLFLVVLSSVFDVGMWVCWDVYNLVSG